MYRRASWLEQCLQFISTTFHTIRFVCERRESVFCNILKCSRNVIVSFSYDSYRGGGCLICGVFKGERE